MSVEIGHYNSELTIARPHNSTYPKGGVSCSNDSFVDNQTFVFQIKFCGKNPALRVAAMFKTLLIQQNKVIYE